MYTYCFKKNRPRLFFYKINPIWQIKTKFCTRLAVRMHDKCQKFHCYPVDINENIVFEKKYVLDEKAQRMSVKSNENKHQFKTKQPRTKWTILSHFNCQQPLPFIELSHLWNFSKVIEFLVWAAFKNSLKRVLFFKHKTSSFCQFF